MMLSIIVLVAFMRYKLISLRLYIYQLATWSRKVSEDHYHEEYMAFIKFKLHL